jgi:peptidoglycan/xylan/chitin deacetylase (PgdA/CDA1 family)
MVGWRWLRRAVVAAAVVLVAGLVAAALVAGRPHVSWAVRPTDNQLTLQLTEGQGPLAGWLLAQGTLTARSLHGRSVTLTLPPGRTTQLDVVVASLWSTSDHVSVSAPPQPRLTGRVVADDALTLNFSTPVMPRNEPCGLRHDPSLRLTLAFPRTFEGCSGTLEVASASGERTRLALSVPPLPPPPPPPPPPPRPPQPREIFTGPPGGGAFYITIDDGWYPSNDVLSLMRQQHIPITAFLISDAAALHVDYWKSFLAAGGEIEDHTVNHPNLTAMSPDAAQAQWRTAADRLKQLLGATAVLGRPPYGYVNPSVVAAAGRAGLREVVMWNAYMLNGRLATADGPLHPGEIVLLHWTPDVYMNLQRLLSLAAAAGLHPAPLGQALAQTGY